MLRYENKLKQKGDECIELYNKFNDIRQSDPEYAEFLNSKFHSSLMEFGKLCCDELMNESVEHYRPYLTYASEPGPGESNEMYQ